MARKRVQIDFIWQILPDGKPLVGFIDPIYEKSRDCPACGGTGETMASRRLDDLVSILLLSSLDALRGGECHPYFKEMPLHETQGEICGEDMIDLTSGLAGRTPGHMGHDAYDQWAAKERIIAAAGLSEDWGVCEECGGAGHFWDSLEDKQAAEDLARSELPSFATPEAVARHLDGKLRWAARQRKQLRDMVEAGGAMDRP